MFNVQLLHAEAGSRVVLVQISRAGQVIYAELTAPDQPMACEPLECGSLSTSCQRWDRVGDETS